VYIKFACALRVIKAIPRSLKHQPETEIRKFIQHAIVRAGVSLYTLYDGEASSYSFSA
jgi:hypothetical protein